MLSSVSDLFDKNFFIGFLLPAVFLLAGLAWLFPGLTLLQPLVGATLSNKDAGELLGLVIITYSAAVLLLVTNTVQYRMLEGYWPPLAWIPLLRQHKAQERQRLTLAYETLMARWQAERAAFPAGDLSRVTILRRILVTQYPPFPFDVMPTRFGNVKRAFETYSLQTYGVDGPAILPHLINVLPKDFRPQLDDARAQVDCLVNMLFVLVALAALCAVQIIVIEASATPNAKTAALENAAMARAFWTGMVCAAASPWAYLLTILRAGAWGDVVKAAFDCYLPALISQLGYAPLTTEADRRAFWTDFNALVTYRQPMTPNRWALAGAPTEPPRLFEHDGPH